MIVLRLAQCFHWMLWVETIAANHVLTTVYTASEEQCFAVNNLAAIFAAIVAVTHLMYHCAGQPLFFSYICHVELCWTLLLLMALL